MQATGEEGKINEQKIIYLSNTSYKIVFVGGWGCLKGLKTQQEPK